MTTVPKEGIWFERETDDSGSLRTYWRGGVAALKIAVTSKDGQWVTLIAWVADKQHTYEAGPFAKRETAEQVAIAAGIGVQVVMPARHVSQISAQASPAQLPEPVRD